MSAPCYTREAPVGSKINWGNPIARGTVAAWAFDSGGSIACDSVKINNITLNSAVTYSNIYGGLSQLTANSGSMLSKPLSFTGNFSFFAIVRLFNTATYNLIIHNSDISLMFCIRQGEGVEWYGLGSTLRGATTVPLDTTVAIAGTVNGTTGTVYYNGKPDGSATITQATRTFDRVLASTVDNYRLNGVIKCLYAWDRALSTEEVRKLSNNPYQIFYNHTKIELMGVDEYPYNAQLLVKRGTHSKINKTLSIANGLVSVMDLRSMTPDILAPEKKLTLFNGAQVTDRGLKLSGDYPRAEISMSFYKKLTILAVYTGFKPPTTRASVICGVHFKWTLRHEQYDATGNYGFTKYANGDANTLIPAKDGLNVIAVSYNGERTLRGNFNGKPWVFTTYNNNWYMYSADLYPQKFIVGTPAVDKSILGYVHNIFYWNRALSSAELAQIVNNPYMLFYNPNYSEEAFSINTLSYMSQPLGQVHNRNVMGSEIDYQNPYGRTALFAVNAAVSNKMQLIDNVSGEAMHVNTANSHNIRLTKKGIGHYRAFNTGAEQTVAKVPVKEK